MQATVIYAHPWPGSFNKAILDAATGALDRRGKPYQLIDLNKDNFDPVLRESDLALYAKGGSSDEMVLRYQSMLRVTDELVFIFPIWWYQVPAILKGFLDKVLLKDFAYTDASGGIQGKLAHIRRTDIFTTSEAPTLYMNLLKGNPIKGSFIKGTLKSVGLRNVKWLNCPRTASGPRAKKEQYLGCVALRMSEART